MSRVLLFLGIIAISMVAAIDVKLTENRIAPTSMPHMLTQADISKVDVKLSDVCKNQSEREASQMLTFYLNYTGKFYDFKVMPPELGEFRVAFVGDSITMGCCGNTLEEMRSQPEKQRITDNKLGYYNGEFSNYPSLLRQLLEKNNKTTNYAMLNYAIGGAKLFHGPQGKWYDVDCRYEQLTKSLPHVVYIAFGFMDSMDPGYNEEEYVSKYVQFIQTMQNLPSKPIVMLQVPMATRLTLEHGKDCIQNPNDPYFPAFHPNCTRDSMLDMQQIFYTIANKTGIPDHHVINSWYLLRLNFNVPAKEFFQPDNVHPNLRGMGTIAQDIFMKMSLSPEIQERQKKQKAGTDEDWNKAVMAQIEQQRQQTIAQFPGPPVWPPQTPAVTQD